jgi:hypothetical protein
VKLRREMNNDSSRIALLPILSDARPNKGEKKNCVTEKEATRIPSAVEPTRKTLA